MSEGNVVSARRAASLGMGVALAAFMVWSIGPSYAYDDDYSMDPSWSDKIGDSIKGTMESATSVFGWNKPAPPPTPEAPSGCPTISVLDGTQAQRVMAPGGTGNESLRYQYSIYNVGRQCTISGNRVSLRVGAEGRVLLGPAGTPSHFDVPIRVVVFDEANQKPVESKLFRVPASIPAGQAAVPFQFSSDNFVVPIAAGRNAADYSIKIGIDGVKGSDTGAPKPHHRRQKGMQSASQ